VNQLDALLLVLLIVFALRGWWRGFCRESLGLAGLFGGVLAAAAAGPHLAEALLARRLVPAAVALPVAWAAIFVATWMVAALVGHLADRLVRALLLGGLNRFAGAVFGSAKGAALLGFLLLLAEHVTPSPALARVIASSRLGRPLEQIAGSVVATGRELGASAPRRRA
jgi:membrane protein required for colicin V production